MCDDVKAKTYPTIPACRISFSIAMITFGFIESMHFLTLLSIHPYAVLAKTFGNFMEIKRRKG
jgi:hypothetical protein